MDRDVGGGPGDGDPNCLSLDDFDSYDKSIRDRALRWREAEYWHWVDTVAWIAGRSPEVMAAKAAYREYKDRFHSMAIPEAACRTVACQHIPEALFENAERDLRRALAGPNILARDLGTDASIPASCWTRPSDSDKELPAVKLPSQAVLSLWPDELVQVEAEASAEKHTPPRRRRPPKYDWPAMLQDVCSTGERPVKLPP